MKPLTLTLRAPLARDMDMSTLIPERLAGLNVAQIGALSLGDASHVSNFFDVSGEDTKNILIRNSGNHLTHVGATMHSGSITIAGDCGTHAGLAMNGGRLRVNGDAGDFAGCGMKAGTIRIDGNAGDFAGGALAGNRQGMRGGVLAIHGNAGDRAGERMRRGLLLVGGNAGSYCGANMLAGTVFVGAGVGAMPGFSLKRGTLLLRHPPAELPVTFRDSGEHELQFLTLLEKQLRRDGEEFARYLPFGKKVRRYCGDLAQGGTGEILVFA